MSSDRTRLAMVVLLAVALVWSVRITRYQYLSEWVRVDRWSNQTQAWGCIDALETDEPAIVYTPHREGRLIIWVSEDGREYVPDDRSVCGWY